MLSRLLAGATVAAALLFSSCASADPGYYPWSNFVAMFTAEPRTVVPLQTNHEPGTVIVSTRERRLYLVLGKGQALEPARSISAIRCTASMARTSRTRSAQRRCPAVSV
jgi:lipoprotein-anchoring transpeptidase ErfK/SrfK